MTSELLKIDGKELLLQQKAATICYFNNEIVEMKEDAVPYIYEELKKGSTLLVSALDRIYAGKVKCDGYCHLQLFASYG